MIWPRGPWACPWGWNTRRAALPGRIGFITVRVGDIEKIMLKAAGQGKSIEEYVEDLIHQDASKN